ncbi:MAG: MATE family efflux transporter [Spirochaetales bacterium]|nr:MATE family efflux transporter [Spirochaetales bacterium]
MIKVSKRDEAFRNEVLTTTKQTKLILKVCLPLAIFQLITQFFNILDTLMASYIDATAVSTVAYMVQLQHMIAAIGGGLSVAGSIRIAHHYGHGDYDKVKQELSSLFLLTAVISALIIISLPFTPFILKLTGTPEGFTQSGSIYFMIVLVGVVINFFNSIYLAIEKSRGNTKVILKFNLITIIVKLSLTAFFIYILKGGINHIAVATLISYLTLFILGPVKLFKGDDAFSFSIKSASLKWSSIGPVVKLAIPTMIEKMSFSFGKALVNNMSASYGETTVGAAGISNNMSGLLTGIQVGIQDGGTSLISQNMGAGYFKRVVSIFIRLTTIEFIIGCIGNLLYIFMMYPISYIFAYSNAGLDKEFQNLIITIFQYEILGCFLLSFCYASISVLLGLKKTKLVLLINVFRIFVFRVPVIRFFTSYTNLGPKAVGYTMMISNSLTGIFALCVAIIAIIRTKKKLKDQA